jgi:hypothetical protein
MANPNPTRKGRPLGSRNTSTLEREIRIRTQIDLLIASGQANPEDFDDFDSLTWMEIQARDRRLSPDVRKDYFNKLAPYTYARKNAITVDPREDDADFSGLTTEQLLALQANLAGTLIEHDPNPEDSSQGD